MTKQLPAKGFSTFIIALMICIGGITKTHAQFAFIPDSNFRNSIKALVPSAIVGDSLDTTNVQIINMASLNVSKDSIYDLTGIQYFDSLKTLNCGDNLLTYLPRLPSTIDSLECSGNNLDSLPYLPQTLYYLNCSVNKLTMLPPLPNALNNLLCGANPLESLPSLPIGLTNLDCSGTIYSLTSLPSLPSNLTVLNCSFNYFLSALPVLPASLSYLYCEYDDLTTLPTLPALLNYLQCSENRLMSLPTLPDSLGTISCTDNSLTSLPSLPGSLRYLYCDNNALTSLPSLPSNLSELSCASNQLDSLPPLPTYLYEMVCAENHLTSIPTLPNLTVLYCGGNLLTTLPPLPTSLIVLVCAYNSFNSLPPLPISLSELDCGSNLLTSLPALPSSLDALLCSNNFIQCLPFLPEGLHTLWGTNAGYTCLPNIPPGLFSYYLNLEGPSNLCDQYNSSCTIYPHITGTAYNDDNANLQQDSNELGHINLIIQAQPGNYFYPVTDTTGYYSFVVDTGSAYIITANAIPYYNIIPAFYSTPVLAFSGVDSLNNFALQRTGIVHDLSVKITSDLSEAWRGFNMTHTLTATNNGTVIENAFLQYVFDSHLNYVGSSPAPDIMNGDTLQWNNIRLIPGQRADVHVTLYTGIHLLNGTSLTDYATVNPVAQDTTHADNVDSLQQLVVGSYDPNNLTVDPPAAIEVASVTKGQWLDYTVRFQNTGNAPALKVEIRDSLSSNLTLSTIQIISSSHPMTWSIRHGIAYFDFNNINLPDSGASQDSSHGFVRFRFKADTTLIAGDYINNTAYIYFDANPAVVTNNTSNLIEEPLEVKSLTGTNMQLMIYPNPAHDELNITGANGLFEIYNVLGEELLNGTLNQNKTISIKNLSSGVYFLKVQSEKGSWVSRFVKE